MDSPKIVILLLQVTTRKSSYLDVTWNLPIFSTVHGLEQETSDRNAEVLCYILFSFLSWRGGVGGIYRI